jgi:hypothetical protein
MIKPVDRETFLDVLYKSGRITYGYNRSSNKWGYTVYFNDLVKSVKSFHAAKCTLSRLSR